MSLQLKYTEHKVIAGFLKLFDGTDQRHDYVLLLGIHCISLGVLSMSPSPLEIPTGVNSWESCMSRSNSMIKLCL